jgi:hypothetical protein
MVKVKCRLKPDSANFPVYDKKYELYKKVSEALDGIWKDY